MTSINICICTCLREQLLARCLDSVGAIQVPEQTVVAVSVIDNDPGRSAERQVAELAQHYPFALTYYHEPRRGIPFARNRAVDEALKLSSDYLVFIDDDEWVQPAWLTALHTYCQSQGGNVVVSGEVVTELHPDVPADIRALYGRKQRATGQRLQSCATNNVLVPAAVVRELGLRFDESNPLAGGTDTIFFVEAVARGVTLLKCVEAVVHETVPLSRSNLQWLSKRKFRAGVTEAWRKQHKGRSRLGIATSALSAALLQLVGAVAAVLVFNKLARNKCWLNVCKSMGVVSGVFGVSVDAYRKIDH